MFVCLFQFSLYRVALSVALLMVWVQVYIPLHPGFHPTLYDRMWWVLYRAKGVSHLYTRPLFYVISEGRSVFNCTSLASGNRRGGAITHNVGFNFCCQIAARPGVEPRTFCSVDGRYIHWATHAYPNSQVSDAVKPLYTDGDNN